jgi:hypothetical protein
MQSCSHCGGCRWICEAHPDLPWEVCNRGDGVPATCLLLQFSNVASGIDYNRDFPSVFDRLERLDFPGRHFPNLRIARGLKLGDDFILGQGAGRRISGNTSQRAQNRQRERSNNQSPESLEQPPPAEVDKYLVVLHAFSTFHRTQISQ